MSSYQAKKIALRLHSFFSKYNIFFQIFGAGRPAFKWGLLISGSFFVSVCFSNFSWLIISETIHVISTSYKRPKKHFIMFDRPILILFIYIYKWIYDILVCFLSSFLINIEEFNFPTQLFAGGCKATWSVFFPLKWSHPMICLVIIDNIINFHCGSIYRGIINCSYLI